MKNQEIVRLPVPVPFGLRMPDDIKAWVKAASKKQRMSVNSWLLRLIEKEMEQPDAQT